MRAPVVLALLLAAIVPACGGPALDEPLAAREQTLAPSVRICTQFRQDGSYSTPSCGSSSPAQAYSAARGACGSCSGPVLVYPEAISPAQAAEHGFAACIDAWQAKIDPVIAVFGSGSNAEDFRASLERINQYQQDLLNLAKGKVDAQNGRETTFRTTTTTALNDMASAVRGPLQTELADVRQKLLVLEAYTNEYVAVLDRERPHYASVAAAYQTFRASEAPRLAQLNALVASAATANLQQVVTLKAQLLALARAESAEPQQMLLEAGRIRRRLSDAQALYLAHIEPFREFMTERGFAVLEHAGPVLAAMERIAAYAADRDARFSAAFVKTVQGLNARARALEAVAAGQQTRQVIAQAARTRLAAGFLEQATARVDELWRLPPKSQKLKLQFQAERHDRMIAFRQLRDLCDRAPQSTPWMIDGCNLLKLNFSKVDTFLTSTLPFALKFQATKLRAAGVDEDVVRSIEQAVLTGQLGLATQRHDAALSLSDRGQ